MDGDNQNKAIIHVRVLVGNEVIFIAESPAVFTIIYDTYVKIKMKCYLIEKLLYYITDLI